MLCYTVSGQSVKYILPEFLYDWRNSSLPIFGPIYLLGGSTSQLLLRGTSEYWLLQGCILVFLIEHKLRKMFVIFLFLYNYPTFLGFSFRIRC